MTIPFGCRTAVYKKNRPARRSVFFCGSCKIRAKQNGLLKELGYEGLFDNVDELWELMSAEHLASYIAVVKAQDELNAQAVQTTASADKRDTFQKKTASLYRG